jgi:hypothetical protein
MKYLLFSAFLLVGLVSFGQSSTKVSLKLTYKGAPLCYWDVTLKHGDVEIGKGKTDDKGFVSFGYVRLLSNSVDASGYKKIPNGDKKWDVKGYISLNGSGHADFDFEPLVNESGMGGMLEAAWGLTLNDCSKGSDNGSSGSSGDNMGQSNNKQEEKSDFDKQFEAQKAQQQADREQAQADWESGKTQAEGLQNSKAMQENKIASANNKIKILNDKLVKTTPGTKEYSELQYEIRETELDRDMAQVKLEKTNRMIAKGNTPLTKAEKEDLSMREDMIKDEMESLKAAKKSGVMYGQNAVGSAPTETKQPNVTTPKETESKSTEMQKSVNADDDEEDKDDNEEKDEENEDALKITNNEELAKMSVVGLKKLKLDSNTKLTNRKVALKTKKALMKPEKITQTEMEIIQLEEQLLRIDAELEKRKGAE